MYATHDNIVRKQRNYIIQLEEVFETMQNHLKAIFLSLLLLYGTLVANIAKSIDAASP